MTRVPTGCAFRSQHTQLQACSAVSPPEQSCCLFVDQSCQANNWVFGSPLGSREGHVHPHPNSLQPSASESHYHQLVKHPHSNLFGCVCVCGMLPRTFSTQHQIPSTTRAIQLPVCCQANNCWFVGSPPGSREGHGHPRLNSSQPCESEAIHHQASGPWKIVCGQACLPMSVAYCQ